MPKYTKDQLDRIDIKELKEGCRKVHIMEVGQRKEDLIEPFLTKVESLPPEELTDELINLYNAIVVILEFPTLQPPQYQIDKETLEKDLGSGKVIGKLPLEELKRKSLLPAPKTPRLLQFYTRIHSVLDALHQGGTESEIIQNADSLYVLHGGKSNLRETSSTLKYGIRFLSLLGILCVTENGIYKLTDELRIKEDK
jgi:hypothetical protein